MPATIRISRSVRSRQTAFMPADQPSSPGLSPEEMIPKDITPDDACWSDLQVREIHAVNPEVREEALLDEAIDLTFPASDPTAELPVLVKSTVIELDEAQLDEAIALTFPASDPIAFTPHHKLAR